MSSDAVEYEGSCLCGQVKIRVEGPPVRAGYCHCKTCRTWHAAPINAVAAWPNEAVHVMQGEALIQNYRSGISNRHWCGHCGSGLMNRLGERETASRGQAGRTVVYAALLTDSGFVHEGSFHIHCDEAMLDLQDGIPKFMGWRDSEPMEEPQQTRMRLASGSS